MDASPSEWVPIRVLHVDADPSFRDRLEAEMAAEEGLQIASAADTTMALDRLADEPIDCVVSGANLSEMNGLEFLETVRETFPDIPFLFLADGAADIASEALARGATDYVSKRSGQAQFPVLTHRIEQAFGSAPGQSGGSQPTERQFQALLEHSSDIISVLDEDGVIEYQSPAVEHVLGYNPEELIGQRAIEYVHPDDRECVLDRLSQVSTTTETTTGRVEFRIQRADGTWCWLEAVGSYRPDPEISGYVINSRDVTDRKERREALEALQGTARELMRAESKAEIADVVYETADEVLDLPLVGVWLYDEESNELRPTAYPEHSDVIPDDPPTFTPGNSLAWEAFEGDEIQVLDDVQQQESTHNPHTAIRSELIVPFGDHGVLNSGATDKQNFDETDRYLAEILGATTTAAFERVEHAQERLARQRELERQNDRLEMFARVVSHDLRNPLTVATGYLDLIDDNEEAVSSLRQALDRMDQIISDVLSMTEKGKPVEETQSVQLSRTAEKAWQTTETNGATLDVAHHRIEADPQRLQQLLENLFRNSVEHGSTTPRSQAGEPDVTVRVGPLENGFYVEDDGPGIPDADREHVFERGFSTHDTGSGLGLAIVEQIATAHGWSVGVTESEDGGARFEFTNVTCPTDAEPIEELL